MTPKPQAIADYSPGQTELAEQTLLEVWSRLGDFHDHLVLVGGLAPRYIVPQGKSKPPSVPPHCGTMDVDLGVSLAIANLRTYATLRETLTESLGFEPGRSRMGAPQRHSFSKKVGGAEIVLDFLTTTYEGPPEKVRQVEEDLSAIQVEGLGLALVEPLQVLIEGELLHGGHTKQTVRVCRPVPFVVLKALALAKRGEPKDAYDLVYILRYATENPTGLANLATQAERGADSFRHAVHEIESIFRSPDESGPARYARFVRDQEDNPAVQAFAAAKEFINALQGYFETSA